MDMVNWSPVEQMCCCMSCLEGFHESQIRNGKCRAGLHVMYRQEAKPGEEEKPHLLEPQRI